MPERKAPRHLPVPPLTGTVTFCHGSAIRVPPREGVYFLHDLRGVLYVGRSAELRRRYYDHLENETNEILRETLQHPTGPLHFSWVSTSNSRHLEKSLIRDFQPPCNRLLYAAAKNPRV